jgi:hypothetical protein
MTLIRVSDLCGRRPPFTTTLEYLDETLGPENVDYILDCLADGRSAFIGEIEYQAA